MATAAPQTAMEMPQEAASNPFSDPNTMAVYEQMRQTVSPKEFGDEMLAGAAQTAPEDVAAFRSALEQIELPPEALDLLNNMVDEILANPDKYEEIRAKYSEMGAPDEILPEQFDAEFFSALNMAVDQMIGEPAGVQAFAQGGIAELKPIAKAIASYGRNGDTMLAHITPAEARMLRRKGGSGTINPKTGLPEYFGLLKVLSKSLKAIGKAVKSFAKSTVGKIVLTVALGYFLGPAAASMLSVSSAAGVAAVSGFVGAAGSTMLAGGNLKDSLKAGAIGGLTAGATAGISGAVSGTDAFASGSYTGPTTISGQVDKFTGALKPPPFPEYTAQGALTDNASSTAARQANLENLYKTNPEAFYNPNFPTSPEALADAGGAQNLYEAKKASLIPDGQGGLKLPAGQTVGQTTLPGNQILTQNVPISAPPPLDPNNVLTDRYTTSLQKDAYIANQGLDRPPSFMDKATNFYNENISPSGIQEQGAKDALTKVQTQFPGATPDQIMNAPANSVLGKAYASAMPGAFATYAPMTGVGLAAIGAFGGYTPSNPDPSTLKPELMKPVTQRIAEGGNQKAFYVQNLPGVKYDEYGAPVFGQYNPLPTFDTGLGIASLAPRGVADGGYIGVGYSEGGVVTAEEKAAAEAKAAEAKAAAAALAIKQAADRKAVADAEAAEKAAGFGNAYKNINAGLSYDVPAGIAATSIAARQTAFAPTMNRATQAQTADAATLARPYTPRVVAQPYNITSGYNNLMAPAFDRKLINMSGIASLAAGGYPRKTGQINGPGTATSDSIPAMLSDGEFVMTAKAVRGAGKGDRRAGAKRMYALMNQLEKNAARG